MPEGPPPVELAALGVARVSWALFLYWDAVAPKSGSRQAVRVQSQAPAGA